jgi:putative colanic acid biosynthesis UDP-glucose lipid carrier transferase
MYISGKKGYFYLKRVLDLAVSSIFLTIIFPFLFLIIAIGIKIDCRGPVFFKQRRIGKAGRSFICYKFRSMHVNSEADSRSAVPNDERITRFGRFLRSSNLDELPQMFNVLIGDMSLVGPRPHMVADVAAFTSLIPGYEFRNLVRPGLTGLAQVKGFSGPAESRESKFGRYQWDAFYVRNAELWLDLRIIRKTIFILAAYLVSQRTIPFDKSR